MKEALKGLLGSKKFYMTLTSIIVYIVGHFGLDVSFEELAPVMGALGTFVIGQGIADNGKERAKIEAGPALEPESSEEKPLRPTHRYGEEDE